MFRIYSWTAFRLVLVQSIEDLTIARGQATLYSALIALFPVVFPKSRNDSICAADGEVCRECPVFLGVFSRVGYSVEMQVSIAI